MIHHPLANPFAGRDDFEDQLELKKRAAAFALQRRASAQFTMIESPTTATKVAFADAFLEYRRLAQEAFDFEVDGIPK